MRVSKTLLVSLPLFICCSADAQSVQWLAPVDGDWFFQGNWSDLNVPDAASEIAMLGHTMPYSVTLGQRNMMLGGIEITNPDAELVITDTNFNQRIRLRGDILNEGSIRLVEGGSTSETYLVVDTDLTLSGAGSIELEAIGNRNDVRLEIEDGATLTIDAMSTIRGHGYLGDGSGSIINNGTIEGAMLVGSGMVLQNNGTIRATDPAVDMLLSGSFIAGSGQFQADDGATIDLYEATLSGVVFEDDSPGSIGAFLGNPSLIDVTSRRLIEVTAFRQFRSIFLSSSFHNDGVLRIEDPGRGFHASVIATDDTLISGDGYVELFVTQGESIDSARIGAVSNATMTIGPGQSITGHGIVGSGYGVTVLEGHVFGELQVGNHDGVFINNGLVQAVPGGADLVISGTHAPGSGTYRAESGARISLVDGSFEGVRVETTGTGTIGVYTRDATLNNIVNNGTFQITNENFGRTAFLHSGIENNGLLQVLDLQSASPAVLHVASDSHISGNGTIELSVGSTLADQDDAQVKIDPGVTLTVGAHQTATGTGMLGVGDGGTLINDGLITGGLQVGDAGCVITNNGIIHADDPTHSLRLGGIHSSGQGVFAVDAGCRLNLFEAKLVGVIINDVAPGRMGVYESSPTLSTDTQLLGTIEVVAENLRSATLYLESEVYNDGVIELVDQTEFGLAALSTIESGALLGTGQVVLGAEPESIDGAQISAAANSTLDLGSGQLISGFGRVGGGRGLVRNYGTIEGSILIGSQFGSFQNNGIVRAVSGNDMQPLTGTHLPGTGTYVASDGATLDLGDALMSGVTLNQDGSGRIGAFSADPTLSGFTNLGRLSVSNEQDARSLHVDSLISNSGVIQVVDESGGLDAVLVVDSDSTLSGPGSLELVTTSGLDTAGLARVEVAFDSTLTIDSEHSVNGTGVFGGSFGTITNNGTVDPGGEGETLRLAGTHAGGSGAYVSSAGTLDLYDAQLNTIQLNGSGAGRLGALMGDPHMTDVILEGPLEITNENGHRYLNLYSSIENNGVIRAVDAGSPSNAVLYLRTDTVFNGSGRIELLTQEGSHPSDAQVFLFGGAVGTIGADQTVFGSGQMGNGSGSLIIEGTLDPGAGLRLLELRSDITLTQDARLQIELGGTEAGTYDRLQAFDGVVRAGHVRVELDQGYAPSIGDQWIIINGGSQSGQFTSIAAPQPPAGAVYRLVEDPAETILVLTCEADMTGDLMLNFFDVSQFLIYFDAMDARADLNNDGEFNFYDVSRFLTSYGQGCAG